MPATGGFVSRFTRFLEAHGGEVLTNKLIVLWPEFYHEMWQPELLFGARLKALILEHKHHFEVIGSGAHARVRLLPRVVHRDEPRTVEPRSSPMQDPAHRPGNCHIS